MERTSRSKKRIRYAVVGLGHIAQVAVLPAFANAKKNSELAALVSDDPTKRDELGQQYGIERVYSYDQYDECLESGEIDAVYIALPNDMHCEYTERAAQAGIHVLCEKPMALTEEECQRMIDAAAEREVKLMIAYRLHFEEANLKAVEMFQSGELGEPKLFNSVFNMQVKDDNIRVEEERGGGPLFDIGIYCINAARYLFRDEPEEVVGFSGRSGDPRFREVEECMSAVLRFPGDRLASFTCSFGAADASAYRISGTAGELRVEPAYGYTVKLKHHVTRDGKTKTKTFSLRDQFAPELLYFSKCVLDDKEPEPSGKEGLADVRIIRALMSSAESGRAIKLADFSDKPRPGADQIIKRPPVSEPELVHAESAREGK